MGSDSRHDIPNIISRSGLKCLGILIIMKTYTQPTKYLTQSPDYSRYVMIIRAELGNPISQAHLYAPHADVMTPELS